jgi:SAM-dependent methyltransferase
VGVAPSQQLGIDEAIRHLRSQTRFDSLVRDAYLGPNVEDSAERFRRSAEFAEVCKWLGYPLPARILDVGAGNGIAAYAFVSAGVSEVYALEPSASDEVGTGAIERLADGRPIRAIPGYAEAIPLPDESVDAVYVRQVLHHTRDLRCALAECARVLRVGGRLVACREHVVQGERDLQAFLRTHPLHVLTGGEHAYRLTDYLAAITAAGLKVKRVLGPYDSVVNAFPAARTHSELEQLPVVRLRGRIGPAADLLIHFPGARRLLLWRLNRPCCGKPYSFVAEKAR